MSAGSTGLKSTDKHQIIQECESYNQLTLTIEKKKCSVQIGPEDYTLSNQFGCAVVVVGFFISIGVDYRVR